MHIGSRLRKAFDRVNSNNEEPRHSKVRKGTGFITKASSLQRFSDSQCMVLASKKRAYQELPEDAAVQAMMMDILSKVDDEARAGHAG